MFVRNNSGDEAQKVISEFDILIDKEVAMRQNTTTPNPGQNDVVVKGEHLHPRYFEKGKFELFEKLVAHIVRERTQLADYSFVFRTMQKDGYIYSDIGEYGFRGWLKKTYQVSIDDKLKTLSYCTTDSKQKTYSEIVKLY